MKKNILFIIAGLFFAVTAHAQTVTTTATTDAVVVAPATVVAPAISQDLFVGSRGEEVKLIQEILIADGLLSADSNTGFFGNKTSDAVKKWQEKNNIPSVGRIGPKTRELMNGKAEEVMKARSEGKIPATVVSNASATARAVSPVFKEDMREGSRGDLVRALQQFLISKGLLTSDSLTGFFGTHTGDAVKKWQEENKLPSLGVVGPMTRALLNKEHEGNDDQQGNGVGGTIGQPENEQRSGDNAEDASLPAGAAAGTSTSTTTVTQ